MNEIHAVVEVRAVGDHRLWVRFDNGVEGVADLSGLTFTGVFAPLKDPDEFAKAMVHPEFRTVFWPTGADLDPVVLYSRVTGRPIDGNAAEPPTAYNA